MAEPRRVPIADWGPEAPSELDAYFKLWARTDTGVVSYWHTGIMYGVTDRRTIVPLVRFSGLLRVFVEPQEHAYRTTIVDAVVFSDTAGSSDEPLETLRNPITGRTVTVRHFFEGPFTVETNENAERVVGIDGADVAVPIRPRRWQTMASEVGVSRDIYAAPTSHPVPEKTNATPVQIVTLVTFSASLAALRDSRTTSVAQTMLSQQFVGPWMPWLGMSGVEGSAASCGTGQKLAHDLSDLPRAFRKRVARIHPAILRSVEHWTESAR